MKLQREEQILDQAFRKQVIEEIKGPENVQRKNAALRAYEMLNGNTRKWVIEALSREFGPDTVSQMASRATNIPVLKKVAKKLAQTYLGGVDRNAVDESAQEAVDEMAKFLKLNEKQTKSDRYFEVFRNALVGTVPVLNYKESTPGDDGKRYDLKLKVLAPHFYDVICDKDNPECPRVVILTDFVERNQSRVTEVPNSPDFRPHAGIEMDFGVGDGIEQTISQPTPDDDGVQKRTFIWWSDKYHFTTDVKGEIIAEDSPPDRLNPIGEIPFVGYHGDQDGQFYAHGWEDRIDGALHINVTATDMFCIANAQGWGQPVLTGKNLPEKIVGGPHRAIIMRQKEGEPEPKLAYVSSNPPLDQWMSMIELDVALYLSTNDLSPATVASKLNANNVASGIAMMIEGSESTADVQFKQGMFSHGETAILRMVAKWQKVLGDKHSLSEECTELPPLPEDLELTHAFHQTKPVISEQDHVKTLQARKDLGLNTMLDLIKKDNPGMSDEEAKTKLAELQAEKDANMAKYGTPDGSAPPQQPFGQSAGNPPATGKQPPPKQGKKKQPAAPPATKDNEGKDPQSADSTGDDGA